MISGVREAGCFRELSASYNDYLRFHCRFIDQVTFMFLCSILVLSYD